jgi:hypothetical protein
MEQEHGAHGASGSVSCTARGRADPEVVVLSEDEAEVTVIRAPRGPFGSAAVLGAPLLPAEDEAEDDGVEVCYEMVDEGEDGADDGFDDLFSAELLAKADERRLQRKQEQEQEQEREQEREREQEQLPIDLCAEEPEAITTGAGPALSAALSAGSASMATASGVVPSGAAWRMHFKKRMWSTMKQPGHETLAQPLGEPGDEGEAQQEGERFADEEAAEMAIASALQLKGRSRIWEEAVAEDGSGERENVPSGVLREEEEEAANEGQGEGEGESEGEGKGRQQRKHQVETEEAEEAKEAEEAEAAKEAAAVKEVEEEERQEEARAAVYQQPQLLQPAEAAPTSKAQVKLKSLEAELQAELSRVGSPHEEPRSARIPRQQPGVGYYAFRNFLVFLFVFLLPSLVAFIKQKLISRTDGRVVEADFPAVDLLNLKF